jgi:hypothetical protein
MRIDFVLDVYNPTRHMTSFNFRLITQMNVLGVMT